jgi:serine/threonine-protein kinase
MDRHSDALRDFDVMIRSEPELAIGHYLRSLCWRSLGEHDRQRDDLEQAVRLAPDWSDACNWLSWLLATCPEASIRDGARAVELGRRALEHSSDQGRAGCLDTLAAALAENGNFDEAVDLQREAISLVDDIDRRLGFERRLLLYESRQPYREDLDN